MLATHSTAVFACLSKACAPPPVGKGGSLKGPSAVDFSVRDEAMNKLHATRVEEIGENEETTVVVTTKIMANGGVSDRMREDKKLAQWVQDNKDKPPTPLMAQILAYSIFSGTSEGKAALANLSAIAQSSNVGKWGERLKEKIDNGSYVGNGDYVVTAVMERLTLSQCIQAVGGYSSTPGVGSMSSAIATLVTRHLIDTWAKSSTSSIVAAPQAQVSANRVHGVPAALKSFVEYGGIPRIDRRDSELLDIYTRAEYEVTQEFLKENGIESLVVSRGVTQKKDSVDFKRDDVVDIQMNPLSSWSYNMTTAAGFAYKGRSSSETGVVLHSVIPASAVQSTAFTGRGCLTESEVILVGHAGQATVGLIYE